MSLHNIESTKPTTSDSGAETGYRRNMKDTKDKTKTIYACWLDRIPSIGAVSAKRLLAEYGNAERLYRLPEKEVKELSERKLLTAAQAGRLREWQTDFRYDPHRLYEEMTAQGIRVLFYEDREYPERLRDIPEPPNMLYVRGDVPDGSKPGVSIVGARLCSDYGRYTARKFAHALAEAGVQIISGMALGIDGISHQAAMEAGGRTFAVLGCGVDVCYPAQNKDIYERIPAQGGILSEYPPGTAPCAGLFPRRNRIISGLADVLLVIEARKKSGTLITVDAALEQGKEVYALPGRVTDALSGGCNGLIAQGAGIATSPEQLLEELSGLWGQRGLRAGGSAAGHENRERLDSAAGHENREGLDSAAGHENRERLDSAGENTGMFDGIGGCGGAPCSGTERLVYALLSEEGQTVDMLMSRSALAPGEFSDALMHLCISGRAVCRQGRYYRDGTEDC